MEQKSDFEAIDNPSDFGVSTARNLQTTTRNQGYSTIYSGYKETSRFHKMLSGTAGYSIPELEAEHLKKIEKI